MVWEGGYMSAVLYLRLSGQFQICFFFFCRFFLRKDFECKKVPKRKINGFHPLRSFCAREIFLPLLLIVCLILFCQLGLVWFAFLRSKSFCQKSKETWNCPDNVKYNTSNRGLFYWLLENSKNTGIPSSHFLLVKIVFFLNLMVLYRHQWMAPHGLILEPVVIFPGCVSCKIWACVNNHLQKQLHAAWDLLFAIWFKSLISAIQFSIFHLYACICD